jgi:DNA-binding response OmpR family regulator
MKSRVLLVEDDNSLNFVLKDALQYADYAINSFFDGQSALNNFKPQYYHVAIIDVMLPILDGFNLAKQLKQIDKELPIIFLTARSAEEDKINGFKIGADDYLTKPFSVKELLARLNVIINRSGRQTQDKIGAFIFSEETLTLSKDELEIKLTQREAALLKYFCQHKNQLLKREEILKAVWGDDDYFMGRSLDVFISKIRKYLEADKSVSIKNHHGVGFKLTCD